MNVAEIMKKDLITIDSNAKISEALSKMRENDIQQLPVMLDNKYVGMLTYKNILRRGSIRTNSRVYNFSIIAPKISQNSDVMEAVKLLMESGLNSIPVFEKEKLVGIVTRMDIIRNINEIHQAPEKTKNFEIMTADVISVDINEEIEESSQKIRTLDEYEIPVTNKGKLAGILRLKEIINNIVMDKQKISYGEFTSGKSKVEIVASSLMDNPISSTEDATISETAALMVKNHLHVIPITDNDSKITGIVGITDILNSIKTGSEEGFYIEISGLEEQDRDLYDITYFMADKFLENISRIIGNNGKLMFYIRKYKAEGKGKYSIRTKLITPKMHMEDDGSGYNYGKCLSSILSNYETRIKGK
ncbi:CBS domain-containing protein [Ferroplasma sp.]|uniref:CBS domain-containing protein n=1 Tax=Ferroplasma sp. TaxID=2591003 RepID=UPI00307EB64C